MGEAFTQVWDSYPIFSVERDGFNPGKSNSFVLHNCGTVLPDSQVNETWADTATHSQERMLGFDISHAAQGHVLRHM